LKADIRGRLKDKIMFGSDYPSIPYDRLMREWSELSYPDGIEERIFHGNAERVLGL
jgi:predicted TIM-barrel fold metal-dependent hydrolase